MSNVIHLPRKELRAMLNFAGQKDVRYYLNAVHVESTERHARLVATNGHIAALWRAREDYGLPDHSNRIKGGIFTGTLPRAVVAAVPRKGAYCAVLEQLDAKRWRLDKGPAFELIDGLYPDYRSMFTSTLGRTTPPEPVAAQFDARELAAFAQWANETGDVDAVPRVRAHGPDTPALVAIGQDTNFIGLIQPRRESAPLPNQYEWVFDALEPAPSGPQEVAA